MAQRDKLTWKERFFGQMEHPPDEEAPGGTPARRTPGPPPSSSPPPSAFVEDELYEDDVPTAPLSRSHAASGVTTMMTQEQLRQRRMAKIEQARVGRPFHELVMLVGLKAWLLIGPIAFVGLTAAEVAYILTHLVAPNDRNGQIIIWAGAMFIELAMMFTTYGVGLKRRDVAEQKEVYGASAPDDEKALRTGTVLWVIFALINIIGQSAFLSHVVAASHDVTDPSLLTLFIVSRVAGFILGDAGTAFFLGGLDNNDIKLMARAERQRGKLYAELADAEGERKITTAEADAKVQLLELDVESKRSDAHFLASLKRQTFTHILEESSALDAPRSRAQLPAPSADEPITGEFASLAERSDMGEERVRLRRTDKP